MSGEKYVPILFKGEMVRTILSGNKTQTRRILNPQPDENCIWEYGTHSDKSYVQPMRGKYAIHARFNGEDRHVACSWQKGQILWVKETWWDYGRWERMDSIPEKPSQDGWVSANMPILYDSDCNGGKPYPLKPDEEFQYHWRKMPSLHLKKKDARIFLKVTNVRVERLLDISQADAIAEGIRTNQAGDKTLYYHYLKDKWGPSPVHSYHTLWESINGLGSWEANSWVFVIEFEHFVGHKNPWKQ